MGSTLSRRGFGQLLRMAEEREAARIKSERTAVQDASHRPGADAT